MSNEEKLAAIEDALYYIGEAKDALHGVPGFDELFGRLDDIWDDMKTEREELDALAAEEYKAEIDEQSREYHRSLL